MTPEQLLALFEQTAAAIKDALDTVKGVDLRDRTSRPGQYALDLVADKAALEILNDAPVTIVSEESGVGPQSKSGITVVIDPVDGSSNAARGIPYWATSLCALDCAGSARRDGDQPGDRAWRAPRPAVGARTATACRSRSRRQRRRKKR